LSKSETGNSQEFDWNNHYLVLHSQHIYKPSKPRKELVILIAQMSTHTWLLINLHDEFDFNE